MFPVTVREMVRIVGKFWFESTDEQHTTTTIANAEALLINWIAFKFCRHALLFHVT